MTKRKPSSLGKQPRKQGEVVKHHLFDPETQELLGVHCRQYYNDASKRMWWTQPNGTLGLNGRKPNTLPLYGAHHMPAVSPPGTIVVIVEGETARDALSAAQILAVGTVSGAPDAPTREALVASRLTGVIAVLWPDASTVGIEMMQRTEQQLNGVAAEILWIQFTDWPAAPELEEDAVDFIQRYGPGAARDLIAKAIVQCSALPSGLDEPQATTQVQHGYGEAAPRQSQATQLVELASVAEFFHAPGGEPHVTLQVGDHRETWPVRSSGLRLWLRREFYRATGKAPSSQAIQDALGVLEAQARFDGPEIPVFVRVGDGGGTLYFDLVNARWEAVAITATGWRVVADPPVRFVRAHGMLPLSTPMPGGNVAWLRRFVNVDRKTDFVLYASYIVAALRPRGPYPVLILTGEQGSAKSTAERVARELIDPNVAPLRSEAREVRDLMIAARNGWMVALDNLSMLSGWMSRSAGSRPAAGSPPGRCTRTRTRS